MAVRSSTRNILLDLTLVNHNLVISYDAAYYHNINPYVAIYGIVCALACCFRSRWLPFSNSNCK